MRRFFVVHHIPHPIRRQHNHTVLVVEKPRAHFGYRYNVRVHLRSQWVAGERNRLHSTGDAGAFVFKSFVIVFCVSRLFSIFLDSIETLLVFCNLMEIVELHSPSPGRRKGMLSNVNVVRCRHAWQHFPPTPIHPKPPPPFTKQVQEGLQD